MRVTYTINSPPKGAHEHQTNNGLDNGQILAENGYLDVCAE